jgi:hypothetical protein
MTWDGLRAAAIVFLILGMIAMWSWPRSEVRWDAKDMARWAKLKSWLRF